MKKIIYLKTEIKIGEMIVYQELEIEVTQTLIDNNPDIFRVIDEREKTLEDYENMLLRTNIDSINAREVCWFYHILKGKEPKLYYTKILQLIADDLNDERYIHIKGNTSYHLSNTREVNVHCGGDEGCVYFKSRELAEKARDILGEKIEYI